MVICKKCGLKYNPDKTKDPWCPKCETWDDYNTEKTTIQKIGNIIYWIGLSGIIVTMLYILGSNFIILLK